MTEPQVLIIGLDGATFDLIEPWAAAGDLPNLARLMANGAWGPLRSTIPAMTFPAWSTMMTGVNPGRHGIFDFTRRRTGSYQVEFVNATYRRHPSLWHWLSQAGRRVGVVGVPTTYPPEPVNGLMVAGFDAPVTTGIDASFVHPPELYQELRREVGQYRITDFQELNIGPGWHRAAFEKLQTALADRATIAEYLLKRERWDCFMVLFGESDTVGHHFWAFHDQNSPRYAAGHPDAAHLQGAIRTIYRQLDAAVGRLMAAMPKATVIVLSDHGFGGTGDKVLYLNRWLAEQGYLKFVQGSNVAGQILRFGKRVGLKLLPSWLQEQVFRRGGGQLANQLESRVRFGGIDWATTRAFSEESNTCPAIWLNVAGREAEGSVAAGQAEVLREEIIARLAEWHNPDTGQPVVAKAWRREALYDGPFVDEAPDIVLELALDEGYAYTCLSSQGRPGPATRRLTADEYLGAKGQSMNGSHRADGILIMAGPAVRQGVRLTKARLLDLTPTVLTLLDQALPVQFDGQILHQALVGQRSAIPTLPTSPQAWEPQPIHSYDSAEANVIEARLRSLGYLE